MFIYRYKNYQCSECDQVFAYQSTLDDHVKAIHLKIKDFECSGCDQAFSQSSSLNTHIRVIHKKIKDHACNSCKKNIFTKTKSWRSCEASTYEDKRLQLQ